MFKTGKAPIKGQLVRCPKCGSLVPKSSSGEITCPTCNDGQSDSPPEN